MMFEVKEKIFYFTGSNDKRLLGILYKPQSITLKTGIVYCHPFAEEKNMSHNVAVKACRAFAGLGYPVLRFDMNACGDSEGDLDDVTIDSWNADIDAAAKLLMAESGLQKIAFFGLRLGGGMALLASEKRISPSFLILWEPILDFTLYIKQFLRMMISTQIVASVHEKTTVKTLEDQLKSKVPVNIMGYPITEDLYESFHKVSQKPMHVIPQCPVLLLSISLMEKVPMMLTSYHSFLEKEGLDVSLAHIKAEPFWDRYWRWECPEALQFSIQWLSQRIEV
jgi:exosortase A-associated hydrolase 2